jgi:hypothetical protein
MRETNILDIKLSILGTVVAVELARASTIQALAKIDTLPGSRCLLWGGSLALSQSMLVSVPSPSLLLLAYRGFYLLGAVLGAKVQ